MCKNLVTQVGLHCADLSLQLFQQAVVTFQQTGIAADHVTAGADIEVFAGDLVEAALHLVTDIEYMEFQSLAEAAFAEVLIQVAQLLYGGEKPPDTLGA